MAIASTRTMLPLDTFFKTIGYHPLHSNGVVLASSDFVSSVVCGQTIAQDNWQTANASGREEVAQIIAEVESLICERLNFSLVPQYVVGERQTYPHPRDVLAPVWWPTWRNTSIRLARGFVQSGGVEGVTRIAANAAVVYSDADMDGYAETATITVTVPNGVTDGAELHVYYPGESGAEEFEVRPLVSSVVVGNTATLICHREQLVRPELLFGLNYSAVEGTDNSQFLTVVDVYRRFLDPSSMIEFRWQACVPGQFQIQSGVLSVSDARNSYVTVQPAVWNTGTLVYDPAIFAQYWLPDLAVVSYRAGWPLVRGQMDPIWVRVVSYLALAMLDRPLCGCDAIKEFTNYWSDDRAMNAPDRVFLTSRRKLENPLGTSRAAIYVWDLILRYRIADALAGQEVVWP